MDNRITPVGVGLSILTSIYFVGKRVFLWTVITPAYSTTTVIALVRARTDNKKKDLNCKDPRQIHYLIIAKNKRGERLESLVY